VSASVCKPANAAVPDQALKRPIHKELPALQCRIARGKPRFSGRGYRQ